MKNEKLKIMNEEKMVGRAHPTEENNDIEL